MILLPFVCFEYILIHTKREARDIVWAAEPQNKINILIHTKREARDLASGKRSGQRAILIHTKREARDGVGKLLLDELFKF